MATRVSFPEDCGDFLNIVTTGIFGKGIGVAHGIGLWNFSYTKESREMFRDILKRNPDKKEQLEETYSFGEGHYLHGYGCSKTLSCLMSDENINYIAVKISLEEAEYRYMTDDMINPKMKDPNVTRYTNDIICDCKKDLHANVVIINKKDREIERFEPHGPIDVVIKNIDKKLKDILEESISDINSYTFFSPRDCYKNSSGPQTISCNSEILSNMQSRREILGGFCGWWCMLYLYSRLFYARNIIIHTLTTMDKEDLFSLIWWFRQSLLKQDYESIKCRIFDLYS